jgi:dipeptidyl aminopeptidase/acylaminoacyl peptidase
MRQILKLLLICITGLFDSPAWSKEISTGGYQNLRINARWPEPNLLEFRRKTETGQLESVQIDAVTGDTKVKKLRRSGLGQLVGGQPPRSESAGNPATLTFDNRSQHTVRIYWIDAAGNRHSYGELTTNQTKQQPTYAGHTWQVVSKDDAWDFGNLVADSPDTQIVVEKPLGKYRGTQSSQKSESSGNQNLVRRRPEIRRDGNGVPQVRLDETEVWRDLIFQSPDLQEANDSKVQWTDPQLSPDGKILIAWRLTHALPRTLSFLEPPENEIGLSQVTQRPYVLPGDELDRYQLFAWQSENLKPIAIDLPIIDFESPICRWRKDHHLLVEKTDRGHQRFRLFSIDTMESSVEILVDERSDTFLWASHGPSIPTVTYWMETDQLVYATERSGYRHLELIDMGKGSRKTLTKGDWLVRSILHSDPQAGELWIEVGGYYPDQDPYHRHHLKVSVADETPIALTQSDGDHTVVYSPDRRYLVVTHSRVDSPPVHELRDGNDGHLISSLAQAIWLGDDPSPRAPIRFVAKGRDGVTDIWGHLCFPADPETLNANSIPIIENIYAGPHDSHVPKTFRGGSWYDDWTAKGFAVVQIDGMGTANRSKSFHDVCWKNLADAGFPDRIAWIQAAAKKHPCLDVNRVGIYGTSAGGQNAAGALLFHPDFYKAAVASCGCHDNRMDKRSWNEQWMGYPVGPHYAANSNIENAEKLQGKLLLMVGAVDDNVPPESTMRFVNALVKADRDFSLLVFPDQGHSDGGIYGRRRTIDFLAEALKPIPLSVTQ